MKLEDFDYPLPKELIAQKPAEPRDASRLLVVDRKSGRLEDCVFRDIAERFGEGDVLVLNDTKVFPARLRARKKGTGGKADLLLISQGKTEDTWKCLVQPALREGQALELEGGGEAEFLDREPDGMPLLRFHVEGSVREHAERHGQAPLPPYIKREPVDEDRGTYQTVYAKNEGAVAAPTAGLHFTERLLAELKNRGVELATVTLHVGYGTFRPVEDLENHRMHAESFELKPEVADRINRARAERRLVWAVGTTTLRVLETCVQKKTLIPGKGETDLYVKPPFRFEVVDRLVTNFHLPKTTLLLLVSAFMGEELRRKAYAHAVAERYRFYSYGDAMLIL